MIDQNILNGCISRFRYDLHISLWDWLVHNPGKDKIDWFKLMHLDAVPFYCFACEACTVGYNNEVLCEYCPINWGVSIKGCCVKNSPYRIWDDEIKNSIAYEHKPNAALLSYYAAKIRDMSFKEIKYD